MNTVRSFALVLALVLGLGQAFIASAAPVKLPTRARYAAALKDRQNLFAPELQGLELETAKGALVRSSGTFATVFFAKDPARRLGSEEVVLRVQHDPSDGNVEVDLERMGEFNEQLAHELTTLHEKGELPPEFLPFTYVRAGLRVDGQAWPVALVPRVRGAELHTWIQQQLEVGQPDNLMPLARNFRAAIADAAEAGLTHGDLQHRNIRVSTDDELRIIDYDGMHTEKLARAGHDNGEGGRIGFQHPAYVPATGNLRRPYDAKMDRFASIVIYLSLISVAHDPTLWKAHHDETRLIFDGETDFVDPDHSELFHKLTSSSDPMVRRLSLQLVTYLKGSPGDVPTLEEAIHSAEHGA